MGPGVSLTGEIMWDQTQTKQFVNKQELGKKPPTLILSAHISTKEDFKD